MTGILYSSLYVDFISICPKSSVKKQKGQSVAIQSAPALVVFTILSLAIAKATSSAYPLNSPPQHLSLFLYHMLFAPRASTRVSKIRGRSGSSNLRRLLGLRRWHPEKDATFRLFNGLVMLFLSFSSPMSFIST